MEKVDGEVQRIAKLRSWSEAEGKHIVAAWRQSGVSRVAFARRYGLAVHRLYYWIKTAGGRRGPSGAPKPLQFHPVRVLPNRIKTDSDAPIEIRLIRVPRGFAPEELRAVLAALDHRVEDARRCSRFHLRSGSMWPLSRVTCAAASMDCPHSRGA